MEALVLRKVRTEFGSAGVGGFGDADATLFTHALNYVAVGAARLKRAGKNPAHPSPAARNPFGRPATIVPRSGTLSCGPSARLGAPSCVTCNSRTALVQTLRNTPLELIRDQYGSMQARLKLKDAEKL
jgi:hypothetical protein